MICFRAALCSFALFFCTAMAGGQEPIRVYVSSSVESGGDGTVEQPFDSIEAARDFLRTKSDRGPAEIVLQAGRYFRDATLELDGEDSYLTIRADEGGQVILDGGRPVPLTACQKVADASLLSRLADPLAAEHLYVVDLSSLGIKEFGEFGPRGFRRRQLPAPVELFIDQEPLTIARWPNAGQPDIKLRKVVDTGSIRRFNKDEPLRPGAIEYETPRAEKWTEAEELYLHGFFSNGFADDSLPVARIDTESGVIFFAEPHFYGIGAGKPPSVWRWFAENLLEEIDQPRESFLNRQTGQLYFYAPADFDPRFGQHTLQVSLLDRRFVTGRGVDFLTLEGLVFESSRSGGAALGGNGIRVIDCVFRNLGGQGLSVSGDKNLVEGCRVANVGAGGVAIDGGDRRTLQAGNSVVRHCDISRVNRWYQTYRPAVSLRGVGNCVQHNHLHDCPGQGIILSGNDHLIEFNELGHLVEGMSDQGAIYMGRNPSCAGNVFRYNYFHDSVSTHEGYGNSGIFFDDGASGQFVYGNVFRNCGRNGAVKYHGGQFNSFVNNIVIDCAQPVTYQLWDQQRWDIFLSGKQQVRNLLQTVNVLAPPYSTRYPRLAAIHSTPYSREKSEESRNWITTIDDPLFADVAKENFAITDYEKLGEQLPGFAHIDWAKIGPLPKTERGSFEPTKRAADLAERLRAKNGDLNRAYDAAGRSRPLWLKAQ